MKSYSQFIRRRSLVCSALILWGCFIPIHFILWFLFEKVWGGSDIVFTSFPDDNFSDQLWFVDVFNVVIIGPILETIFCQALIFFLLSQICWFAKNKYRIVFVGTLLFGLIHFYSISYILFTLITGALFLYAYILNIEKGVLTACSVTIILHGLTNLFALFLEQFE